MTRQLPVRRPAAQVRRPRTIRRSSRRLAAAQLVAIVAMLACLGGTWAAGSVPAFAIRTLDLSGARFTSPAAVRAVAGMTGDRAPNAFGYATDGVAAELARLPAVESARVEVRLPSTLVVSLVERQPKLIWAIGDRRYVVDEAGVLFGLVDTSDRPIPSAAGPRQPAAASASPSANPSRSAGQSPSAGPAGPSAAASGLPPGGPSTGPSPGASGSASASSSPVATASPVPPPSLAPPPAPQPATPASIRLPIVFDRRVADASLGLGDSVDAVSLDAGYRIAGLTPADLDSSAGSLATVLDDTYGFTLSSVPAGWVAEFGFYTPHLRQVDVIPTQVRDLRSLFAAFGEGHVAWAWLMAGVPGQGDTYLPR